MPLVYLFIYTFFLAMVMPLLFPHWHLLYFVPFIVLCFYRCKLTSCLIGAFICGFIVDLFSAETALGNSALNYCLTTLCLYRYRYHFFEDRFSTLSTMTFFFSCLSTIMQVVMFSIASRPFALTGSWLFQDLFFTSFQSALYAIFAFKIPALIFSYLKRRYLLYRLSRSRS